MSIGITNNPAQNPNLGVNQPIGTAGSILDNLEELSMRMAGNLGTKLAQLQPKMNDPVQKNINYAALSSSMEDLAEKAKDPDKLGDSLKRRIFPDSKTTAARAATEPDLRSDPADIDQQKKVKERHQNQGEETHTQAEAREIDMGIKQKEQDKKQLLAAGLLASKGVDSEDSKISASLIGKEPFDAKNKSTHIKTEKNRSRKKYERSKKEKRKSIFSKSLSVFDIFRKNKDDQRN